MTALFDATPPVIDVVVRPGPQTRTRLRRTTIAYTLLVTTGILLLALAGSAGWQAFGVGLWFPGAGFLAAGGWWSVLMPVTLVLFVVALVAWFGAGFTTLLPAVWLGAAGSAAAVAGDAVSGTGVVVATALLTLGLVLGAVRQVQGGRKVLARRAERLDYLPTAIVAVRERAVAAPVPDSGRELSPEAVSALRYVYDRALQEPGRYTGYDQIDQFQTSALRYQINTFGYCLNVQQAHYTPNFHGYGTGAQRSLVDTYLQRKVWGYWRWENAWGNLRLDGDPVGKDNIMLTGFFGLQVGLYTASTGDRRYLQPGGLTFRHGTKDVYSHDLADIAESLISNMRRAPFCLYPCEPNWTYTACNFRGMAALQAYDRVAGTEYFDEVADEFRHQLETEFINPDLSMVSLRSMLTGLALPFPLPEGVPAVYLNSMFPDLAERYWAIIREEQFTTSSGELRPVLPKGAVDMGNYKPGYALAFESLYAAALEHGDSEAAAAALDALAEHCDLTDDGGVLHYRTMSNSLNGCLALDRMLFRGAWRDTVVQPTSASALEGPVLDTFDYPGVLVAKAASSGDDLDLVLYPGLGAGVRSIDVARLVPGATYDVTTPDATTSHTADAEGRLAVPVRLDGRTPLSVTPRH